MVKREAGFTLVEVILVMAITGALLLIAVNGQSGSRSNQKFVSAVDLVIGSINNARNEAASGVNSNGTGLGGSVAGLPGCSSVTGTPTTFGGTSWLAMSNVAGQSNQPAKIRVWVTDGPNSCDVTASAQILTVGTKISVTLHGSTTKLSEIAYARVGSDVRVCFRPDVSAGSATSNEFKDRLSCANATASPWQLDIRDNGISGHKAIITIDPVTGLAHR